MTNPTVEYVPLKAVAIDLGCCYHTVYNDTRVGRLPCIKRHRVWMTHVDNAARYIKLRDEYRKQRIPPHEWVRLKLNCSQQDKVTHKHRGI